MAGAGTWLIKELMKEADISQEKIMELLKKGVDNRDLGTFADPEEHEGLYEDLSPTLTRDEVERIIELVMSEEGVGKQVKLMLAEEQNLHHEPGSYAAAADKERLRKATAKLDEDGAIHAAAADAGAAGATASTGSLSRQLTRHTTQPEPETARGGGRRRRKSKKRKSKKRKSKKKKTRRRRTRRR